MTANRLALGLVLLVIAATPVVAHVPAFPADNTSPADAVTVPNPTKSWVFYDRLAACGTVYYRVTVPDDTRFVVSVFTPIGTTVTPSIAVLEPGSATPSSAPPQVSVPDGMTVTTYPGEGPSVPTFEPFTPSAIAETATVDRTVDTGGTYLIAVYDAANRSGPVGVTVGYREEFSATEFLRVPFDVVRIHLWAGQPLVLVIAPWVLAVLGGIAAVARRGPRHWTRPIRRSVLGGAALVIVGSGLSTALQLVMAGVATGPTPGMIVTAVLSGVPLVAGAWSFHLVRRPSLRWGARTRTGLAIAGLASLVTWAGFVVAPLCLLLGALLPAGGDDPWSAA